MKKWLGNSNDDVGGSMNRRYFMSVFRKVLLIVTACVVIVFVTSDIVTVSQIRKIDSTSQQQQQVLLSSSSTSSTAAEEHPPITKTRSTEQQQPLTNSNPPTPTIIVSNDTQQQQEEQQQLQPNNPALDPKLQQHDEEISLLHQQNEEMKQKFIQLEQHLQQYQQLVQQFQQQLQRQQYIDSTNEKKRVKEWRRIYNDLVVSFQQPICSTDNSTNATATTSMSDSIDQHILQLFPVPSTTTAIERTLESNNNSTDSSNSTGSNDHNDTKAVGMGSNSTNSNNTIVSTTTIPVNAIKRCQRVVMDFGANIGDTFGHVLDTGFLLTINDNILNTAYGSKNCSSSSSVRMDHFDVKTKHITSVPKRNNLTPFLTRFIGNQQKKEQQSNGSTNIYDGLGPEDYCYYGVEGNPVFTERLQAIEHYIMKEMDPVVRPIEHMHFFTESVGAGTDGPMKLYLDTINKGVNFWGSSILPSHRDVQSSAKKQEKERIQNTNATFDNATATGNSSNIDPPSPPSADVMGYTLGTIMRKTLLAFDNATSVSSTDSANTATTGNYKINHLILKLDIEGAEYMLLESAMNDGTLCQFVQDGNTADLIIEYHGSNIIGTDQNYTERKNIFVQNLTSCGVTFHDLDAAWARL